ncbi:AAA family ATPase [Ferrimicrobium sp.]|uniref:AAA family ATPase n=1 Tax=Ferrimicrobium sp. TaxID=2926050 RepID=UPI00260CFBAF|nr:AAA family ATPase [Ferrimicrobium sp.]
MSNQPLVVLLAGLPGSGKYSFAPYLAKAIGAASVLDTDKLFDAPRIAVGAALGLGTQVVDEPQWKDAVHGRLLSLFIALASTAATPEHPVVAVSPWTGFRQHYPEAFDQACAGLTSQFRWVIATCPPEIRHSRIRSRARAMDATKIATLTRPDPVLTTPLGAITVDLGCDLGSYPTLAYQIALELAKPRLV